MNVSNVLRKEVNGLWSDGKGISLVAIAIMWVLLVGARMICPIIIMYHQSSFNLSLTVAGFLVTVLWFCSALGQFLGGILADRYSERTIMAAGALIVTLGIGTVVTAKVPLVLFVATAIWGFGHSLYPVVRIMFLSDVYPDRLGSALGVTMATGDIGQTVLPPLAAVLALSIAWQAGLWFVIPALIVLAIVIVYFVPNQNRSSDKSSPPERFEKLVDEIKHPTMGLISVMLFLYIFIWQSFTAFYPTYLITVKDLSPSIGSIVFGIFSPWVCS